MKTGSPAVEEYISSFPAVIQAQLNQMRETIARAAPAAEETIDFGFYPTPSAISHFAKAISAYKGSKGAVLFPFGQPLPLNLIERMTSFRIGEWEGEGAN